MLSTVLERPVRRMPPHLPEHPAPSRRWLRPLDRVPADAWIVLALWLVTLAVHGINITGFPAVGDDEGTYLAQAWAVQQGYGLAHYTYWYDHPPLGWLQLAAVSWLPALLPEHLAVAQARVVMLPLTLVSVALLYLFARRLALPRWAAALAAALFALSPLTVVLGRQIYLDNIALAWMLGAFVLALSPSRHLWHHIAAAGCAAVAVLSKETMLLVLPALLLALWRGSHPTTRKFSLVGFAAAFGLLLVLYPLYAVLNGELLPGPEHVSLWDAIAFQLLERKGSGSFLEETSPARGIVNSWLYYDPVLPVGGVLAAVIAAVTMRRLWAPAAAVLLLLAMALRPGYLPAMYVIQALPFLALCIAGVLAGAVGLLLRRGPLRTGGWRWARAALVAVIGAALAGFVVPRWAEGDRVAMTRDANAAHRSAVAMMDSLPHGPTTRVLVDDGIWLDLVRDGYQPGHGAIWFYKIDLDPAVELPRGWRDVDYVVSTPVLRAASQDLPNVSAGLANSAVVASFGEDADRIEIRRIVEPS